MKGNSIRRRFGAGLAAMGLVVALLPTTTERAAAAGPPVFINEFHYDNAGTDAGEFIEVAGPAGTDLTGWTIVLYNGANGLSYNTTPLPTPIPDLGGGFGVVVIDYPTNGIQNGSPDGIALVDNGTVVQFLSYEGSFTAGDGPANGLTSADIGVAEESGTAVGDSLQLTGTGSMAGDFTWSGPTPATSGAFNTGQTFVGAGTPPTLVINEINADPATTMVGDANGDGTPHFGDDEFVEIYNDSGFTVDLAGWTLRDGFGPRHTFPTGSTIPADCSIVVFGGGTPTGLFGSSTVQTASSGALGLNNGGDSVTLNDGTTDVVSASYGSEGGADQSLTRSPDVTGPFVQHSTVTPGLLYSPGTKLDGTAFGGCPVPQLIGSGSADPAAVTPGGNTLLTVAIAPASPPSTGLAVTADLTAIGGSATQALVDDGTGGDATAGDLVFSYEATVGGATVPGNVTLPASFTDAQGRSGSTDIALTIADLVEIWEIQGSGQFSPLLGDTVLTRGIVTLIDDSGTDAWIQTPASLTDGDPATSDGIFVDDFNRFAGPPAIGDLIVVSGEVEEQQFGNALPRTRLDDVVLLENLGAAEPLPPAVPLVDLPNESVPDGIAFWEALEGMRVSVANGTVVAGTSRFGEFGMLTPADAVPGSGFEPSVNQILLRSTGPNQVDYNPERILVDDDAAPTPQVQPGDTVHSLVGVVDYTFGAYKLQIADIDVTAAPLPASPASTRDLTQQNSNGKENFNTVITTFNVENLFDLFDDPTKDDQGSTPSPAALEQQMSKLALAIETELLLPEIIVAQEVENTWIAQQLADRVNDATGTDYVATSFETSDARGIEVAFLWDANRVDLLEAFQLSGPDVEAAFGPGSASPGREPLYGKFRIGNHVIHVVGNHFKSKGGDDPIFGVSFNRITEVQRKMQAQVVRGFVDGLLAADRKAEIIVAGDLNDFQFGEPGEGPDHPVAILEGVGGGAPFTNLVQWEDPAERWSFVFDGNTQVLDHALVNATLLKRVTGVDFLHFNAEFPAGADQPGTTLRSSDHDPLEVRLRLRGVRGNDAAGTQRTVPAGPTRFATFNASLNRFNQGGLITSLTSPNDGQAKNVAETLQRVRPDVVLINEFDFDAGGVAAGLFQDNYLSVSQRGALPIHYSYVYVAPSNTGIPSGFDLDNNGFVGGGNDAFGFGFFPGNFAYVVYSMHPIDTANLRTFQHFLWKDMPGALLPDDPNTPAPADWYSPAELDVFRLSSKNHVDVPIVVGGETIHFLVSHPTPPVFDGPEDRNGTRNHDEIRFWADYVDGAGYIYDDDGGRGGLPGGAKFVIAGDLNADPFDGDSVPGAAQQLLDHPLVNTSLTPSSAGAVEQAALQGGANAVHVGNPAFDTADFADGAPGNLRVDYVLPSSNLDLVAGAVFWPLSTDPLFRLVGTFPFPTSDHRLVWVTVD